MPKKKQISIDFIEETQLTINDLLDSDIPQFAKRKLCKTMEKLCKEVKQPYDNYKYLYWNKHGKLDWEEEKEEHLSKLSIGDKINIPQEYVTGPDYDGSDDFTDRFQGEWSRMYY